MRTTLDTQRLYFREFVPEDDAHVYLLDSDPQVHLFLGNKPARSIDDSRNYLVNVRQQYIENGIGRWTGFTKDDNEFIGWVGLKLEKNVNGHHRFYDLGYRLRPKFWNHGYATEAARGFLDFGFNVMKLPVINAYASAKHAASRAVLEKVGLQLINTFEYECEEAVWYALTAEDYVRKNASALLM